MTEQKFEPVAWMTDGEAGVGAPISERVVSATTKARMPQSVQETYREPLFTAAQMEAFWLLGHKEGAGYTAAQMRQARIQALEEAVDAVPVVMDHEAYKAAVTAIRALMNESVAKGDTDADQA